MLVGCTGSPSATSTPPASPKASSVATSVSTPSVQLPVLTAIQRLNSQVGYIASGAGSDAILEKTTDGGKTWRQLTVPAAGISALRFIDEQTGWVAGFGNGRGLVLRTGDGGATWVTALDFPWNGGRYPVIALQAIDGQVAWVLTEDASGCTPCLQRTTDGGHSWRVLVRQNIALMRFASANRGWIVLSDPSGSATNDVRMTSDGGQSWQLSLFATDGQPDALDAASVNVAWVLTRNGGYCTASNCDKYGLYRTNDGGRSWAYINNPKDQAQCSGGNLAGPLFASPLRGWLGINLGAGGANVGPGGVMRTDDAGATWRCSTTPPNIDLLSAADPLHLWAAGPDRAANEQSSGLYASDDGGASWHRLTLP